MTLFEKLVLRALVLILRRLRRQNITAGDEIAWFKSVEEALKW